MATVNRTLFVQGASRGIGLAIVERLLSRDPETTVIASCRHPGDAHALTALAEAHPDRCRVVALDVRRESSIAAAASAIAGLTPSLDLVMNVSGMLHGPGVSPEKKLDQVDADALRQVFEVNAFGPLLVGKHFARFLRHDQRSVFASLSARIGSISDNRLGGWYAYRGSKAAQNMFTKTIAIELSRIAPRAIVLGLHPGTVDTSLSKPFQRGVPASTLLTPAQAAEALLGVVSAATSSDSGRVFDFRGKEVLP
ncbi:MAG: SDR family NAD(P)-dependent oxidoreductase [Polyangiales bacterium]